MKELLEVEREATLEGKNSSGIGTRCCLLGWMKKKKKRVGRKCLQGGGLLVYGKGTRPRMKNGLLKGTLFFFFALVLLRFF